MSKHTAGPWCISSGFMIVGNDMIVASCLNVTEDKVGPAMMESNANARLIAAAPTMYEVLKDMVDNGWNADIQNRAKEICAKAGGA